MMMTSSDMSVTTTGQRRVFTQHRLQERKAHLAVEFYEK